MFWCVQTCVFLFRFLSYLRYFRVLNDFFGYFSYKITELENDPIILRIYTVLIQLLRTGPNPMGSELIPY